MPRHCPQYGHPAECLERQAAGPLRRRGDPEVAISPNGDSRVPVLQQGHEEAQLLLRPLQNERGAVPHLELAGREGRLQIGGRAEDLGCLLGLLQADAEEAARQGHARRLCPWAAADHHRAGRRQRHVPLLPDRLWRQRHRHQGRQAAARRSAGQGGGDQGADLHHHGLQGRLRPARRAELERRRRQQRVPRQANDRVHRRHDLARSCVVPQEGGVRRHRDDGLAARQCGQADSGATGGHRPLRPEGSEERRGGQRLPEISDPAEGDE